MCIVELMVLRLSVQAMRDERASSESKGINVVLITPDLKLDVVSCRCTTSQTSETANMMMQCEAWVVGRDSTAAARGLQGSEGKCEAPCQEHVDRSPTQSMLIFSSCLCNGYVRMHDQQHALAGDPTCSTLDMCWCHAPRTVCILRPSM